MKIYQKKTTEVFLELTRRYLTQRPTVHHRE